MLLDETPNTFGYMLAGFLFLFGLPVVYVLSWFVRQRNLEKDIELMRTLSQDEKK